MDHQIGSSGRLLTANLAIAALLVTGALSAQPASALLRTREAARVSARICDYRWKDGVHQVKRLIRCAARRWHVSGGPSKALRVARCESGYDPSAYNPSGYLGIYQQAKWYWAGRAVRFGFPDRSAFNGRANVIVSIRMAHASGWGGWGCA
jgi:soluble lytic murein transglycosylase-like protein